jgi:hypothetical protein
MANKIDNKLFKEAVADAKAVKSIALKNAEIALQEAFNPTLQSMISDRIREADMFEDEDEELGGEVEDLGGDLEVGGLEGEEDVMGGEEELGLGEEEDLAMDDSLEGDIGGEESFEEPEADLEELQPHPTQPEMPPVSDEEAEDISAGEGPYDTVDAGLGEEAEYDMEDEDEMSLESVLSELSAELTEEEDEDELCESEGETPAHTDDELHLATEDYSSEPAGEMGDEDDDDEEIDLNEIISEILAEEDDHYEEDNTEDRNTEEYGETPALTEDSHNPEFGTYDLADEDPDTNYEDSSGSDKSGIDYSDGEEMIASAGAGRPDADYEEGKKMLAKVSRENAALRTENVQLTKVYKFLKSRLNEINLLNAKLLFINKLFKEYGLNNDQKKKIVESFDYTKSVREAKLVYATLAESFNTSASVKAGQKKKITEGASRPVKSTKPTKAPIVESAGDDFAKRMQELAGIKK